MVAQTRSVKLTLAKAIAITVALEEITQSLDVNHARLANGLRLMVQGKAQFRERCFAKGETNNWVCYSQDGTTVYAVNPDALVCTCPDNTHRDVACKHIVAVWLERRVSELLASASKILAEAVAA